MGSKNGLGKGLKLKLRVMGEDFLGLLRLIGRGDVVGPNRE